MRNAWFGDNRDLVKWSVLLHIATQYHASVIVQICFLNRHEFPPITLHDKVLPVPLDVIKHFRSVRSVERLSSEVLIKVFDHPLTERRAYMAGARDFISKFSDRCRALLLDPDTGLAPRKTDFTHVTEGEAGEFWSALAPGDVLVLYQHQTNRSGTPWVNQKREQLASAIGIPSSCVRVAKCELIARDVVFYYAIKQRRKVLL